jgi:NADPH2:quinone reductase
MRAIVAGNEGAVVEDVDSPSPGPDQVLVRVKAGALNRADLLILNGAVHGGWGGSGFPLGLEFAGEVVETGPGVDAWRVGNRVMGAGPRPSACNSPWKGPM